MKVKIEISGDPEYCYDEKADRLCKFMSRNTIGECELAKLYGPPIKTDKELKAMQCEYDIDRYLYKKCRWCLENFPVDNPER